MQYQAQAQLLEFCVVCYKYSVVSMPKRTGLEWDNGGPTFDKGDFTLISKRNVKRDEIEDKVIWITGASRGIGEVLAKQLANLGAKLIISARNEAELERVQKQLTGKHAPHGVKILPLDLTSGEDFLEEAVRKAVSFFPDTGVDYMFHNAAFERPKTSALEVSEEGLKATFDVNVFGTISLTRILAPYMLKRGKGHFVVMSSAAGKAPAPGQAMYSASKHALNGYFHTLRSELFQKGIKVTVVCPGPIETSTGSGTSTSENKGASEKRVSSERCAELTIIAASHGLKEAWISNQPVLAVMYLVQYMPTVGFWLMDKVGGRRVEAAAQKGNTYSIGLLFGKKKSP
ncbi:Short-chain dehydrogenase/reductase [Parasponia andersonii]|uniref:Short-chain dehydrogenase/reductase n=1 Tax=Parasponia andersonii TaxID=3476 RepID=A0A2P5CDL6_PARAD|nr:Short-chain dehydrogenase/reductase [Parasponia andersonii]